LAAVAAIPERFEVLTEELLLAFFLVLVDWVEFDWLLTFWRVTGAKSSEELLEDDWLERVVGAVAFDEVEVTSLATAITTGSGFSSAVKLARSISTEDFLSAATLTALTATRSGLMVSTGAAETSRGAVAWPGTPKVMIRPEAAATTAA